MTEPITVEEYGGLVALAKLHIERDGPCADEWSFCANASIGKVARFTVAQQAWREAKARIAAEREDNDAALEGYDD